MKQKKKNQKKKKKQTPKKPQFLDLKGIYNTQAIKDMIIKHTELFHG